MIRFDFDTYNSYEINNYDLNYVKEKMLKDNKLLDWYHLKIDTSEIKKYADKVRNNADVFIVIGIGGSSLGAQAVINSLSKFSNNKPEIIFLGSTLSSDYINSIIEYIKDKEVYINVISKSGNTLETILSFDILYKYLKNNYNDYKDRIIITTNNESGLLLSIAQTEKIKVLNVSNNISGRYSLLSSVGLFPIAVAGIDIDSLIKGALYCKNNLDNCYKYTKIRNIMHNKGINIESFDIYDSRLSYFTEWLKQLFAESQGKDNRGILPISTLNSRDLHSLGQYYQQGKPIIFSTIIYNNNKDNISIDRFNTDLNTINNIIMKSVVSSRINHMNSNIIYMDCLNEYNIGYLIFFFEMSACLGSYIMGVNYYDQPGVNQYKDMIYKELSDKNSI